jgi:hypothetical protein
VIVQVLQVLQRFSSGAERFRFNRPVVQSSGVQRCRQVQSCRGAEVVLMCRVAELQSCRGGAEIQQRWLCSRLCRCRGGAAVVQRCEVQQ